MSEQLDLNSEADRKLTTANLVTMSRLLMLPFIVMFLVTDRRTAAFVVMLISLLTDIFDGYLARRLRQVSKFGKVLDPISDKVSLAVILITLLAVKAIPWWVVLIIVVRDLLILIGSFVIFKRRRIVYKSNIYGKIAGFLFGALVLAFTINLTKIGMVLLYIAVPMMMIAFGTYIYRYFNTVRSARLQGEI